MKPIFGRGPSLQFRFVLALIFSIGFIIADARFEAFSKVRFYMDSTIEPLIWAANMPYRGLDVASDVLISRRRLLIENKTLRQQQLIKDSELQILGQLMQENKRLRELLGSPVRHDEYKMVTQVLSTDKSPYSDQIVIDKGASSGVYEGQPVLNEKGVVGQVVAVAQKTSRVLLLCDNLHAIPVQVLRNDVRVIAIGTGCIDDLQLEFLPLNADIEIGDELVTSGLGGHFPEGYPVATVSSVTIDRQRARTIVHARPVVNVQRLRYLLLLWPGGEQDGAPLPPAEVQRIATERQQNQTLIQQQVEKEKATEKTAGDADE